MCLLTLPFKEGGLGDCGKELIKYVISSTFIDYSIWKVR